MRKVQGSLPLAFALAIAAEAGAEPALNVGDATQPLRAGVFAPLADRLPGLTAQGEGTKHQDVHAGDRVAQFFPNFRNCLIGTWRNC